MGKMTAEQKRKRIQELEKQIKDAEDAIYELLEPAKEQQKAIDPPTPLPEGFSVNEKVLEVIIANPEGISKEDIRIAIKNSSNVDVTSGQVQSALAYLKNTKKLLRIIGRGMYKHEPPQT